MISTEDAAGNGSSNLYSMLQVEIDLHHITNSWAPWLLWPLNKKIPWLSCGIRNVTGNLLGQVFNSLCYACDFPEKQKQTDFLFIVQHSRPVISRGKKGKLDVTAHYSGIWLLSVVCKIPGKGFTLTNLCKHLTICLFSNSAWRERLCSGDCGQKGWSCAQPCIYLFSKYLQKPLLGVKHRGLEII